MTSPRLLLFMALLPFHLMVFNGLRWLIAREDGEEFTLMDGLGWLDARSSSARRYRTIALLWILIGALGCAGFWLA